MNFFRSLQAPPNPLLEAYTAATGRAVQDAVAPDPVTAGTDNAHLFTILAVLDRNRGVLDHTTPGLPTPPDPTGEI